LVGHLEDGKVLTKENRVLGEIRKEGEEKTNRRNRDPYQKKAGVGLIRKIH